MAPSNPSCFTTSATTRSTLKDTTTLKTKQVPLGGGSGFVSKKQPMAKQVPVYEDAVDTTTQNKNRKQAAAIQQPHERQRQRQDQEQQEADALEAEIQQQRLEEAEAQRLEDEDISTAGYVKMAKVGEGTYGEVFKGQCRKTRAYVALKRIQLNHSVGGMPPTAMREVALLKEIQHTNVIRLVDLIHFDTIIYLVLDYCDIDLRRYMDAVGREGVTIKHIKSFCHQLISGIRYCHTHRILHRDLKPQNLLIDRTGKLKIADLGLSRTFGVPMRSYSHQVITLWYRAPEILLGSFYYSTAVDMWSVGCILAEMITLRPLFPGDSQIDELFKIFQILGTPTEDMWPGVADLPDFHVTFPPWKPVDIETYFTKYRGPLPLDALAIDLVKSLLTYDPSQRISAKRAEEHLFFYDDLTMLRF